MKGSVFTEAYKRTPVLQNLQPVFLLQIKNITYHAVKDAIAALTARPANNPVSTTSLDHC